MLIPTYLKKRQAQNFSKYHQIQGKISSKYNLVKERITSKFHQWNNSDSSPIDQSTLNFVVKYDFPLGAVEASDQALASKKLIQEKLNWSRGRLSGTITSIVVKQGVIIEKVLHTKKGKRVLIQRKELGVMPNLMALFFQIALVN